MEKLLAHDTAALRYAIRKSCEIKASIVGRDEREQGDRALLNLGHTFGHALESATGYTKWLHGEAVGAGLLMAATMSCESGLISASAVERLRKLLVRTGLPTEEREVPAGTALEHMRIDKKVKSGRIRLVLLRSIGASFVTADYADAALQRTLEAHLG
jgi:3-dehydroquinate synthase